MSGCVLGYFSPALPHSPRPNSASGFRVRVLHPRFFHVWIPRILDVVGWGVGLGSPLAGFSPNKEKRFFDDFSIFTWLMPCFLADIFSSWNCGFFWCYLSLQVMAILCCVAKNSLHGTPPNIIIMLRNILNISHNFLIMMLNILNMPHNIIIVPGKLLTMLCNILIMLCKISMPHNIVVCSSTFKGKTTKSLLSICAMCWSG
jgi:hypothetical protein